MPNDVEHVLQLVRTIAAVPADDGLVLNTQEATAEPIRDEELYGGIRVTLTGQLASAQLRFHVDVNIGDPIWPPPQPVTLPRLLEGQIELVGYPLPMVYAEKLVTAIRRGTANTRWRDFADVYLPSG